MTVVDGGRGGLTCCSPWSHKESDMTAAELSDLSHPLNALLNASVRAQSNNICKSILEAVRVINSNNSLFSAFVGDQVRR